MTRAQKKQAEDFLKLLGRAHDGKRYQYDIAYDMPSTIGIEIEEIQSDEVEFL